MRLIGNIEGEQRGHAFCAFLKHQGIDSNCEIAPNKDWESSEYGNIECRIWVINEEQVVSATQFLEEFKNNPFDLRYQKFDKPIFKALGVDQTKDAHTPPPFVAPKKKPINARFSPLPFGIVTIYLVLTCSWLFIWSQVTAPNIESLTAISHTSLPLAPILMAPINKDLLYDYPLKYELVDRLILLYGFEMVLTPPILPDEGQYLYKQAIETPYWQGFYQKIMHYIHYPQDGWHMDAPLFEREREGEIWRIWSPIFLHSDIFHIFFNMFWLVILGNQMETILGKSRYILFIIITAAFSNTAQYLMSGANFIGFSGVLVAMLAFIYVRQKVAAWERYQMQKATFVFIAFFILAMFTLQLASFVFEAFSNNALSLGIANTAHLSGALIGAILGRLNFFAEKG